MTEATVTAFLAYLVDHDNRFLYAKTDLDGPAVFFCNGAPFNQGHMEKWAGHWFDATGRTPTTSAITELAVAAMSRIAQEGRYPPSS